MKHKLVFFKLFVFFVLVVSCQTKDGEKETNQVATDLSLLERAETPYLNGGSDLIFDAKPAPDFDESQWFTNDYTFVIDKKGKLHWIGINNPYPPKGKSLVPLPPLPRASDF